MILDDADCLAVANLDLAQGAGSIRVRRVQTNGAVFLDDEIRDANGEPRGGTRCDGR